MNQTYFIMKFILDFKEITIPDTGLHLFPINVLLDLLGKTQTQLNVSVQTKTHRGNQGTYTNMLQYMQ